MKSAGSRKPTGSGDGDDDDNDCRPSLDLICRQCQRTARPLIHPPTPLFRIRLWKPDPSKTSLPEARPLATTIIGICVPVRSMIPTPRHATASGGAGGFEGWLVFFFFYCCGTHANATHPVRCQRASESPIICCVAIERTIFHPSRGWRGLT